MTLTVTNTANDASLLVGGIEALKFNSQGLITTPITVRQTVELGPVDTNGFASFGGSTGSTTVTASGTLYLNAANGMVNRRGSITNPSWTGLSTNGQMYLYLDISADGSCTSGSTTLSPVYQFGGTYSTTSGQFTFNIQQMSGQVGNGATAAQTYRVFVGEVTVSGNVVTAIVWYALMGRYDSGYTATLPAAATQITKTHNLGLAVSNAMFNIKCLTAENGYSIGDIVTNLYTSDSTKFPLPIANQKNTCGFTTSTSVPFGMVHKTSGAAAVPTAGNWAYDIFVQRSF